jgi:hypothetical protein
VRNYIFYSEKRVFICHDKIKKIWKNKRAIILFILIHTCNNFDCLVQIDFLWFSLIELIVERCRGRTLIY